VLTETDASGVTPSDLRAVLPRFMGELSQIPPMVSAVHHQGQRLYELARQGVTVERQARSVQIDALEMTDFVPGTLARATLDVVCGKGTYIRTLCADLGAALGVGGHMATLRRTRVGGFDVSEAVPLEAVTETNIEELLLSPSAALASLPAHIADEAQQGDIRHGRPLPTDMAEGVTARVIDSTDNLLALARVQAGQLRPFKVFA
jgi:tRNA pseudouridine55 synthase